MIDILDSKVVEMVFDNKDFIQNVQSTILTMTNLKASLNMDNAASGLKDVAQYAKSFSLDGIASALDGVSGKFSAFDIMAKRVLENITDRAFSAGERLVKSLSIENISAGWEKFSNKTTSVATLVSQGYDLDRVNEQLERLNWFTDETSYNFTDMVSNIAKFTAAGQDLETSVSAMEGIANWAALSGQNAATASRAMYQLSQAMGAGVMRKEDYRSIQNASMDTTEFRQKALDAAVALGTLKKNADGTYTSIVEGAKKSTFSIEQFADNLTQERWFTSDVMMEVYKNYGNAAKSIMTYMDKYADSTEKSINTASEAMNDLEKMANDYVESMNKAGKKISFDEALRKVSLDEMKEIPAVMDEATKHMNKFNENLKDGQKKMTIDDALRDLGYELTEFNLKALRAAQEARSWADVVDATKDAVSTAWMNVFQVIFGNYEEAKTLWTNMANEFYDIFATPVNNLLELLKGGLRERFRALSFSDIGPKKLGMSDTGWGAFKKMLYQTAKDHDIAIDKMIESSGSFEKSLREGWLTGDMLVETINKISASELKNAGYTDKEIAKLERLALAAKTAGTPINNLITSLDSSNGRSLLLEAFSNLYSLLQDITSVSHDAWLEIFPPVTADQLYSAVVRFKEFTESIQLSEETLDKLKRALKGAFAILDIGKQALSAILDTILPAISSNLPKLGGSLLDTLAMFGDYLVDISESIKKNEKFVDILNSVSGAVGTVVSYISAAIEKIAPHIEPIVRAMGDAIISPSWDVFASVLSKVQDYITKIHDLLVPFKNAIVGVFKRVIDFFKNFDIVATLKSVWERLKEIGGKALDKIKEVVGFISDKIRNAKFSDFVKFLKAIALLNGGGKLAANVFNMVKKNPLMVFFDAIKNIKEFGIKGIGKVLEVVTGPLEAIQNKLKAESLKPIAEAILILAGALFVLSIIDQDALKGALGSITILFGEMAGAIGSISMMNKGTMFDVADGIRSMGVAILLLSGALWVISKIDPDRLADSLGAITVLIGDMIGVMVSMQWAGHFKFRDVFGLIAFAGAIWMLVGAVKSLAEFGDYDSIKTALTDISVLIGEMAGIMFMLKYGGHFKLRDSIGFIAFAGAMYIMVKAIKQLADFEDFEKFDRAMVGISVLIGEMIGVMATLRAGGHFNLRDAIGFIAFAQAISMLTDSLLDIASVNDYNSLENALVAISLLIGEMAGIMYVLKTGGHFTLRDAIGFIALAGAIRILVDGLVVLRDFDDYGKFNSALLAISALIGEMAGIMIVLKDSGHFTFRDAVGFIALAYSIKIIADSVADLATIKWTSLAKAVIALKIVLSELVSVGTAMSGVGLGSGGSLILMAIAINMLIPPLKALAAMKLADIGKALLGLAGVLFVIGGAAVVLSSVEGPMLALAGIILAIGAATLMAGAGIMLFSFGISMLADVLSGGVTMIVDGIKAIVLAFLDTIPEIGQKLLEVIPTIVEILLKLITETLSAMVEYIPQIVTLVLGLIKGVLSALREHLPEIVAEAISLVADIFIAVGEAIKNLNGGDLENLLIGLGTVGGILLACAGFSLIAVPAIAGAALGAAALAEIAALLAIFGGLSQIPGLEWIIGEGSDFLNLIGKSIGEFIGSIVGGLAAGVTSSLPDIGSDLASFMINAAPFFIGVKAIGPESFSAVETLANAILTITAADLLDSIRIFGSMKSSIDNFGQALPSLATYLTDYANNLGPSLKNTDIIESSKTLVEMLAALASKDIPRTGGVVQWFMGESGLSTFGTGLPELATSLTQFADNLGSSLIGNDKIEAAKTLVEMLAALASRDIPKTGGVLQWFSGESGLSSFGTGLPDLAKSLTGFADNLGDSITSSKVDASKELIDKLAMMSSSTGLSATGITTLGTSLVSIGSYLDTFGSKIGNIKIEDYSKLSVAMASLQTTFSLLKNSDFSVIDSLQQALSKMLSIDPSAVAASFDSAKETLNQSVNSMLLSVSMSLRRVPDMSADISIMIQNISGQVLRSADRLEAVGKQLGLRLTAGVSSGVKSNAVSDNVTSSMSGAASAVSSQYKQFADSGKNVMANLASGIRAGSALPIAAMRVSILLAVAAARSFYGSFSAAGKFVVQGFANGISQNSWMAAARARAMANAAKEAAKRALDEHSPSKEFYQIGDFAVQGFTNAMDDGIQNAYDSSFAMASYAKSGLQKALANVSSLVEDGMNTEPTIRPVLDLSDISSGVDTMGSMLDINPMVGVGGNIGAISSYMMFKNQSATNDDVVSAINSLRAKLGNVAGNTTVINGITYDDGSNINEAVGALIRAAKVERRS